MGDPTAIPYRAYHRQPNKFCAHPRRLLSAQLPLGYSFVAFTTPRVFNHPLMNTTKRFDGELALRQLPKTMDGDEWSGGIKWRVDQDFVGGFLVSGPSNHESDLARLRRVQPKIRRFVSIVHVVEVVHILEWHSENAVPSEVYR